MGQKAYQIQQVPNNGVHATREQSCGSAPQQRNCSVMEYACSCCMHSQQHVIERLKGVLVVCQATQP